jgi:hypothetical protein
LRPRRVMEPGPRPSRNDSESRPLTGTVTLRWCVNCPKLLELPCSPAPTTRVVRAASFASP